MFETLWLLYHIVDSGVQRNNCHLHPFPCFSGDYRLLLTLQLLRVTHRVSKVDPHAARERIWRPLSAMGLPVLQSWARFRSPTAKRGESEVFETAQSDYGKPRHVVEAGMQRRAPVKVNRTVVRITKCDSGKADWWFGLRRT